MTGQSDNRVSSPERKVLLGEKMEPTSEQQKACRPNDAEKRELQDLKKWITSLSTEGLLKAMEFTFRRDDEASNMREGSAYTTGFREDGGGRGNSGSHEYDLLRQMIDLQPPPPTPIHPRAVPYKPASTRGVTDGQNEEERVRRNRFRRPRLFQLIERRNSGISLFDVASLNCVNGTKRLRKRGRVKKWQQLRHRQFDVIAKKFVTKWGEVLSVGATREQREAFDAILLGTTIKSGVSTKEVKCMFCTSEVPTLSKTKPQIMNMIRIASFGKFLSTAQTLEIEGDSICDKNTSRLPFCAPWFDPTKEWFSLPVYLASRFEVALWESFRTHQMNTGLAPSRRLPQILLSRTEGVCEHVSAENIERAILHAVRTAAASQMLSENATFSRLRDSTLWGLLVCKPRYREDRSQFRPEWARAERELLTPITIESITMIPLLETCSVVEKFRFLVLNHLRDFLAKEAEKNLIDDLKIEECRSERISVDRTKRKNKRRNNRKKYRSRRRGSMGNQTNDHDGEESRSRFRKEESHADGETETASLHPVTSEEKLPSTTLVFAPSVEPHMSNEKNRNIILALLVIEDIIGKVFAKVGLAHGESLGEKEKVQKERQKPTVMKSEAPSSEPGCKPTDYDPLERFATQATKSPRLESQHPFKACQEEEPSTVDTISPAPQCDASASVDESSCSMLSFSTQHHCHQAQSYHPQVFSFLDPRDPFSNDQSYDVHADYNAVSSFLDMNSPVGMSLNFSGSFDGWGGMKRYPSRERSLFAEFFNKEDSKKNHDEMLMTSSTAASIASSSGDEVEESECEQVMDDAIDEQGISSKLQDIQEELSYVEGKVNSNFIREEESPPELDTRVTQLIGQTLEPLAVDAIQGDTIRPEESLPVTGITAPESRLTSSSCQEVGEKGTASPTNSPPQSPSPSEPPTPPPQLSPILVSLADLGKLRKSTMLEEVQKQLDSPSNKDNPFPALVAGSLPSSPILTSSKRLTPSLSREDLRMSSFNEDDHVRRRGRSVTRQADALLSYRNAAMKSIRKPASASSQEAKSGSNDGSLQSAKPKRITNALRAGLNVPEINQSNEASLRETVAHRDVCAQSETALDGPDDSSHLRFLPKTCHHDDADNVTTTKDGATTISSGHSPPEMEELSILREERNAYRDMCLTLGAEVAKLNNILASEMESAFYPSVPYAGSPVTPYFYNASSFDPEFMPPFFHGFPKSKAAMSDAGVQRGDYDSAISEDGTDVILGPSASVENPGAARPGGSTNGTCHVRNLSAGGTHVGSDISLDQTPSGQVLPGISGFRPTIRDPTGSIALHGLQSRLSKDVCRFLDATAAQLKKQDSRRTAAIKRLSRLVTANWPRAQIKMYGSHVSNLCLPSSDLDFVICLPAVHKNAPAVAPGVLEGRNAINETSQKLLARKLKGESWLDPRSIKVIERTVVPVIKVSTKDTRDRMLQLDISFDGPEHHGLAAVNMIRDVMEELPMVRPLVLVLKQFLLDRGLLTAYTGGLSSYCLFLMVTRYLQQQASGWSDCGSLLMGFLDFYGNSFDPRTTGISVGRRQYFSRANYAYQAAQSQHTCDQQLWNVQIKQQTLTGSMPPLGASTDFTDLTRRHSFTEKGFGDCQRPCGMNSCVKNGASPSKHGMRPPRFQSSRSASHHSFHPQMAQHTDQQFPFVHSGRPYTFDPLFVEDPLSSGNNVGRNSFRIFQVQRAFADAHRALVASLEWDINSANDLNDGSDYPLLKCLLQNEDMLYQLEDSK